IHASRLSPAGVFHERRLTFAIVIYLRLTSLGGFLFRSDCVSYLLKKRGDGDNSVRSRERRIVASEQKVPQLRGFLEGIEPRTIIERGDDKKKLVRQVLGDRKKVPKYSVGCNRFRSWHPSQAS